MSTEQAILGWRYRAKNSSTLTSKRNLEISMLSTQPWAVEKRHDRNIAEAI